MGCTSEEYIRIRQKQSIAEFKAMRKGNRELNNKEKEIKNEFKK